MKIRIIESIYWYYNGAPNNSYVFQFAVPYGLKNTVVVALIELILIE